MRRASVSSAGPEMVAWPSRTALGTVRPPARRIGPSGERDRDECPHRRVAGGDRGHLEPERHQRDEHGERDQAVHGPGVGGDAPVVGGDAVHGGGIDRILPDLHVEHEVEPEHGEQESRARCGHDLHRRRFSHADSRGHR